MINIHIGTDPEPYRPQQARATGGWAKALAPLHDHPNVWARIHEVPATYSITRGPRVGEEADGYIRARSLATNISVGRVKGIERGEYETLVSRNGDVYEVHARYVGA